MSSHLIFHPKRATQDFCGVKVHFDRPGGNQDPYVWNRQFLHSYCHITELKAVTPGDVNFWVSAERFRDFNELTCDLVFVVETRTPWREKNSVTADDPLVDSDLAYQDHYRWAYQHSFKRRTRYTLKADMSASFQPQRRSGELIDLLPELNRQGFSTSLLRTSMKKGFASKPMPIGLETASLLFHYLDASADIKLRGAQLQAIRETTKPSGSHSRRKQ